MSRLGWVKDLFGKKEVEEKEKLPVGVRLGLEAHGHKFYVFDSILYAPTRRQKNFHINLANFGNNITNPEQGDFCEMIRQLAIEKDFDGIIKATVYFEGLLALDGTTKMTSNISAPIILIDNEVFDSYETIDNSYNDLKASLCKEHEDIEDFFLSTGIAYIKHTETQLKDIEVLDYLKEPSNRLRENLFYEQINKSIWMNLPLT